MAMVRKLFKVGNSVVVSIPAEWVKYHELKEGDEVLMFVTDSIVIKPKTPHKEH